MVKSLKSKYSHGYDEIPNRLLKLSPPFTSSPLNCVCNKFLTKGIFTKRLKLPIIKPLYKEGNKKDVSNSRPVSLLTSFSKIFEKAMQSRLFKHLHNNNILRREQYGFWMKLTTENVTYKLINEILNALRSKLMVGGIFYDIEKAFDYVNHVILTLKLETCGITGIDKELYESHLKGRYQRVLAYNKTHHFSPLSNWTLIKHGVKQSSILGPLLFLL